MKAVFREQFWQDGVERLAQAPGRGHPRPDLYPSDLRVAQVPEFRRYLVFFRWEPGADTVEFLRVKHGAMNLPARFTK